MELETLDEQALNDEILNYKNSQLSPLFEKIKVIIREIKKSPVKDIETEKQLCIYRLK